MFCARAREHVDEAALLVPRLSQHSTNVLGFGDADTHNPVRVPCEQGTIREGQKGSSLCSWPVRRPNLMVGNKLISVKVPRAVLLEARSPDGRGPSEGGQHGGQSKGSKEWKIPRHEKIRRAQWHLP